MRFSPVGALGTETTLGGARSVGAPGGALPCSCAHAYGVDEEGMRRYMELSKTAEGLKAYLEAEDANLAAGPSGR